MRTPKRSNGPRGYSLAEVLVALVIASMVIAAVLAIFTRFNRAAQAVTQHLSETHVPTEILQLIAEDLDRLHNQDNTRVVVENKTDHGFPVARLILSEVYYDDQQKQQEFRTITWQAAYDFDNERVVLYRKHSGIDLEDKLLDTKRQDDEKFYPFIPVCGALTMFKVEVPMPDGELRPSWQIPTLPPGLKITLSFATPTVTPGGELYIAPEDQISRTIALDRTRTIKYKSQTSTSDENNNSTPIRSRNR